MDHWTEIKTFSFRVKSSQYGGSAWRRVEAVPEVALAATPSRTSRTRLTGGAAAESSL